jgi:hypothetical protein
MGRWCEKRVVGSLIRVSAVCVFALLAVSADKSRAQAEAAAANGGGGRVLVLRPPADDPERTDAFNRLWAELHIHGFDAHALEREAGENPATMLTALVQESGAVAAFAFVRRDGALSLEAVLTDRTSRQTSLRRLAFPAGSDAASLIAVRAVDLLRASLQELPEPERAPEPAQSPVPAEPEPAEAAPPPAAAAPDIAPRVHTFTLAAEGTMIWPRSKISVGFGPALGLFHRPLPWFQWGVWVGGVFGSSFDASTGSASMQQELGFLEARASLFRSAGFELAALAGGGAFFLQAKGTPRLPRTPAQDSVWSALATLGLHAEQSLGGDFALGLSARAIALAPSLGVAIADQRATVRLPALQASLGLSVGF